MRVFKPLQLSLQTKAFTWQGESSLSTSILVGFSFGAEKKVLMEQELWQFLGDYINDPAFFDIGMPKPQAEVLVLGNYYSPGGQAVTADRVELLVGKQHKALSVIGDRYWRPIIGPTPPEEFTQMPVDYQHAFGGEGHALNTIGKGMQEVDVQGEMRLPLPNIENPDKLISDSAQRPEPAGLGPLDVMWKQRASKMGTYDDDWKLNHFPGYPPDLDWTHFMCAPKDQWSSEFWVGDENFSILNMHAEKPQLKGNLPAFRTRCFIQKKESAEIKEIFMNAETLYLFPNDEIGALLFRGITDIDQDDATDIDTMLVAYEDLSQTPRSTEYYEQALLNRLDEEQTFKYMMNTRDIIPDSETCGYALMLNQADEAESSELGKNMDARVDAEKDKVFALVDEKKLALKKQLENAGVDSAPYMEKFDPSVKQAEDPDVKAIMETANKILPGATGNDGKKLKVTEVDFSQLDVLGKQIETLTDNKTQEVKGLLRKTIEDARGTPLEEQVREKIQTVLNKMDELPDLPRPPGKEALDNIKQQIDGVSETAEKLRASGIEENKIPVVDLDIKTVFEQLTESSIQAKEGYRSGAHFIDGSPPHVESHKVIKSRFVDLLNNGGSVAGEDLSGLDLSGMDFSNVDLSGCYLEYANLSEANLSGANLDKAIITHANLRNANLSGASLLKTNLGDSKLVNANLSDAKTAGAEFSKADLEDAKIVNCDLKDMDFLETIFVNADLSGSDLTNSNFLELDLHGVRFVGSNLTACNFVKGNLKQSDFSEAIIEEANFLECVCDNSKFKQAKMSNARFVGGGSIRHCNFEEAILDRANFRDTEAEHSIFEKVSFYMTDFSGANLQHTKFYGAIGKHATFMKSDLMGADFSSVNLMEGSLMKARLTNADLRDSNLYAVEFMGATVGGTDFSGANLDMSKLQDWRPSK